MSRINESFVVFGLSRFGYQTAVSLFQLGAEVTVIDYNEKTIQRISSEVTKAITADVLDREIMDHLGIPNMDVAIIGLRRAFDVTVLLVNYIKSKTKIKRIIVLVDSDEKAEALRLMGVTQTIYPERDSSYRLVKQIMMPNLIEQISLSTEASIVEMECPEEFINKSLIQTNIRKRFGVYVIGIIRYDTQQKTEEVIIAPPPKSMFIKDDKIIILGNSQDLIQFTNQYAKEPEI